jgi:hypothetical protein
MKKIFTALLLIITCCEVFGQTYPVDTIYKTGSLNNRVNVVILGDGFTQKELPEFTAQAKKFADFFLSYSPYNHYRGYFNFFSIPTPSKESGVTNPGTAPDVYPDQPVGKKNTFYSATFGSSIHRLVTVNYSVVFNILASNLPEYDLAVVLVNTKFYGGSGGSIAVHTLHDQADLIGVHEIGHTFTHLNDEYWAGAGYGWEAPNMTMDGNPATIKWKNWINSNGINIYKHSGDGDAASWHKPTSGTCLMEFLNQPFCAVCKEATTEMILFFVNPVEKAEPETDGTFVLEKETTFKLNLVKPEPNSLQVIWKLNEEEIASGPDHITLSPDDVGGYAMLTATIFDSTAMSRKDSMFNQRSIKMEWSIQSTAPGIFKVKVSNDSICAGKESMLTASGCSGTVSWSNGGTEKSITVKPTATTNYIASCKVDGQPISTITSTVTVLPLPPATATNTGPYFVGSTIELNASGGVNYVWSGPRSFTADTQSAFISESAQNNAGIYEVSVTDAFGCNAKATTEVKVDPILAVGKNEEEWVQVSPNPAEDYVKVVTKMSGESTVVIYNVAGKKLLTKSFNRETELKLNSGSGLYLYRITNGAKESTGQLVIQ